MIVWLLDLQLHVQSVTIAIIVVSSNPVGQGILDKTLWGKRPSSVRPSVRPSVSFSHLNLLL
jgi:hypothetical protein